jgi:hypothetical protein
MSSQGLDPLYLSSVSTELGVSRIINISGGVPRSVDTEECLGKTPKLPHEGPSSSYAQHGSCQPRRHDPIQPDSGRHVGPLIAWTEITEANAEKRGNEGLRKA